MNRSLFLILLIMSQQLCGQNWKSSLEAQINLNSNTPYWMRANKFGSVPLSGVSTSLIGSVKKEYQNRKWDWGLSAEVRGDLGKTSNLTIIEGHAKVKWDFVEIKGGRSKEFLGLIDSTLSLGSFSYSGTALGIPKIEIRIPEYWPKNTLISGKGNFAHGWYGTIPTKGTLAETDSMKTYFHQKSLWVRLARPHWKLKLYGGFVDNAFWGDEYKLHSSFNLSPLQRYWSVISGKVWQGSKVGNHVGNIDIRADYNAANIKYSIYRQFFYEVGALWHLANIQDGLLGLSIDNVAPQKESQWKKILLEIIYTKNQAGEPWSKPTPTGNENYMNHYIYNWGWSYKSKSIGVPIITSKNYAMKNLPSKELEYFINNRLWAINVGSHIKIQEWKARINVTYSKNFGTRETEGIFPQTTQLSWYFLLNKEIQKNIHLSLEGAGDHGKLLPQSAGFTVGIIKHIN